MKTPHIGFCGVFFMITVFIFHESSKRMLVKSRIGFRVSISVRNIRKNIVGFCVKLTMFLSGTYNVFGENILCFSAKSTVCEMKIRICFYFFFQKLNPTKAVMYPRLLTIETSFLKFVYVLNWTLHPAKYLRLLYTIPALPSISNWKFL